ncbi:MAG: hypothetical protein ACU837_09710 [Gammaproteobacteria bacterium]
MPIQHIMTNGRVPVKIYTDAVEASALTIAAVLIFGSTWLVPR